MRVELEFDNKSMWPADNYGGHGVGSTRYHKT